MAEFRFEGRLPSSKSLLNRWLIVRSYEHRLRIAGASLAEDVVFLRRALSKLGVAPEFYCGEGGTTFRFFALRASREPGQVTVNAHPRLLRRPHRALEALLRDLGVLCEWTPTALKISSEGWKEPATPLSVPADASSQFASALLLNAWSLPFELRFRLSGKTVSEPYWHMTQKILHDAGLVWKKDGDLWIVPAGQRPRAGLYEAEQDLSSAFALGAIAALSGEAVFESWPRESLQADHVFVDLLRKMGAEIEKKNGNLSVRRAARLGALTADLRDFPDLLPVLAAVACFADGTSVLRGAPQLRHKESDRVASVARLLRESGVEVTEHEDGLSVQGNPDLAPRSFVWDPEQDHRIAMAVAVLNSRGFSIRLKDEAVVAKSFPEFFKVVNQGPFIVIGHRGTGKTTSAAAIGKLLDLDVRDLDQVISERQKKTVSEIFAKSGEEAFRLFEASAWNELRSELGPRDLCVLGAGFRLESAERTGRWLWFRRDSDEAGRVFVDRPALLKDLPPLEESRKLYRHREASYKKFSHRSFTWPEGGWPEDEDLKKIWNRDRRGLGGVQTLLPRDLDDLPPRGPDFYELRNDLLGEEEILSLFAKLPPERVIYSFRESGQLPAWIAASSAWIDWALDIGYPEKNFLTEYRERLVLSSHSEDLKGALLDFKVLSQSVAHLKLCPLVESWEDLKTGHLWWSQDPVRRSFLPRSKDGRWQWYRLWMKGRQRLGFWREDDGWAADQPTLWQWMKAPDRAENFAAVLGSPVSHSWTPWTQGPFFAGFGWPVWAVPVERSEWDLAMPFLENLGLAAAAVTSPLKEKAHAFCMDLSDVARELGSVNTLWKKTPGWIGHNTDLEGLRRSAAGLEGKTVLWGGGGTLPVLRDVFPEAVPYSATRGEPREGFGAVASPEILVWGAPRVEGQRWPAVSWKPRLVFDLNYKEDSPGREYALRTGADYKSGAEFFFAQAEAQREFWARQRGLS